MPVALVMAALIGLSSLAPARAGSIDQSIDLTKHMRSPGAIDGIPALFNPTFVDPSEVTYLADDDLVLGLFVNGEAKAYPENFGWRHEILNDTIGGRFVSVTLCPLTGTGLAFDATDADGSQFQLRVSGRLINSNLVMFDQRDRKTLYPQMIYTGISGTYEGERLELLPLVETTWSMWRRIYPDSTVPLPGTGWEIFPRRDKFPVSFYSSYPYFWSRYGDYRLVNDWLIFPPTTNGEGVIDDRVPSKNIVLGICQDGGNKAYPFATMPQDGAVINDVAGDLSLLVVYHAPSRTAIPYDRRVDGQTLSFYLVEAKGALPVEFKDEQTGTRWDMLGRAVEGPLDGTQLRQIPAYNSMWFAWAAFFPETAIWNGEGLVEAPVTAVEEELLFPTQYDLAQNFPNPFNPETRIQYTLPAPENVRLAIYNTAGQKLRELVDAHQQPGIYLMRWDGRDQKGTAVASGTYLYRLDLDSSGRSITRRMTLAR